MEMFQRRPLDPLQEGAPPRPNTDFEVLLPCGIQCRSARGLVAVVGNTVPPGPQPPGPTPPAHQTWCPFNSTRPRSAHNASGGACCRHKARASASAPRGILQGSRRGAGASISQGPWSHSEAPIRRAAVRESHRWTKSRPYRDPYRLSLRPERGGGGGYAWSSVECQTASNCCRLAINRRRLNPNRRRLCVHCRWVAKSRHQYSRAVLSGRTKQNKPTNEESHSPGPPPPTRALSTRLR